MTKEEFLEKMNDCKKRLDNFTSEINAERKKYADEYLKDCCPFKEGDRVQFTDGTIGVLKNISVNAYGGSFDYYYSPLNKDGSVSCRVWSAWGKSGFKLLEE